MVKTKITLIVICALTLTVAYSQNKKEQIEALNFSLDSLNALLIAERSVSSEKTNEINNLKKQIEVLNKNEIANQSEIDRLQKIISIKSDSLRLLSSEQPLYSIVNESIVIEGEEDVEEGVNEVFYQRLSIPTNISLENKINEMIYTLHNLNSNGYKCDPNTGFDSYLNSIPIDFKKINNREANYFTSYTIWNKGNGYFSLVLNDENFNLIWYEFMIEDDQVIFRFDRKFLDDPDREH